MAFGHGSSAYLGVDDSGDTLRDLSAYLTSTGLPRSADVAEVSTMGVSSKQYVGGLKDGTIPLEGPWDPTVDSYLEGILGLIKDFEYGPQGNTAAQVKYSGTAILTSYEVATGVDDAGTWSAEMQITGDVTRGTF